MAATWAEQTKIDRLLTEAEQGLATAMCEDLGEARPLIVEARNRVRAAIGEAGKIRSRCAALYDADDVQAMLEDRDRELYRRYIREGQLLDELELARERIRELEADLRDRVESSGELQGMIRALAAGLKRTTDALEKTL